MPKASKCPLCQKKIDLVEKLGDSTRLQGFCSCRGLRRCVIEINAEPVKPAKSDKKGKHDTTHPTE
jgi:hypothetical protein